MAIRYLNSLNKRRLLMLCCMSIECREIVESFKLTGEAKRKANTMATFADWLIEDIRTYLDEEQQKQAGRAADPVRIAPRKILKLVIYAQRSFTHPCRCTMSSQPIVHTASRNEVMY